MTNIKEVKNSINNGIREILDVGFAMERSGSSIKKENLVNSYASFPFEDTNENDYKIKLSKATKDDIMAKFPAGNKDGQSLILSLLSIYNENKDKRNHIISIEIENNEIVGYFINTIFLEEDLSMSKLFTDKLKKYINLSESLNTLILMFLNRTDSYYKQRYAKDNYEEYSVYKKIEMLKDITNTIYGSIHTIDELYYLFFTDDVNIKSTLYNYYKDLDNVNYVNKFLYKIYDSNISNSKVELSNAIVNFKDNSLISESQKLALSEINKQISIIIGQGGSGKTFLSSLIMKKFLYIKGIASLNKIKVNTLYTTYSKYSLSQFLAYSNEFKDLIFINDKEHIQNKIASLNQSINMDRYNKVKNKLKDINLSGIFEKYEKNDRNEMIFKKHYSASLDTLNYSKIIKYMKYLKENYTPYGFFDKLLISFNLKKDLPLHIPNSLVKPLITNNINVPEKIQVEDIPITINNINKTEIIKQKKLEKDFEEIKFNAEQFTPLTFEDIDIALSDLIYYLKYQPIIDNPTLKEDYINALQGLLNGNNLNLELIEDLFPIFSGLITDITKFNLQFRQIIVDESVLVPGYFFPLIINKGENIIAIGDINQLSLNQSFCPNINTIVDKIYNGKGFKLSIDNSYNQQSFFGHISSIASRDDMFLLTDNFRCNKNIFMLSKHITKGIDGYDSFLGKYIEKHNLNINKDNLTKHYSDDNQNYLYGDNKFNLILLRAKNLFITIGNKDFLFTDQIENIDGNGYTIINKFIRNNSIDIYELT